MTHGIGSENSNLTAENVKSIIAAGTPPDLFRNKRVLVLTPDATRNCPLPLMVRAVREVIGAQSAQLNFMVAPGTHTPLAEKELMARCGISAGQREEIYDYDLLLILGPVFLHEVVGFSGGAKYLFPGISGGEFLHRLTV